MVMVSMVAVVAMSENRVIGDGKGLIWHIPNDLKRVQNAYHGLSTYYGSKDVGLHWSAIARSS